MICPDEDNVIVCNGFSDLVARYVAFKHHYDRRHKLCICPADRGEEEYAYYVTLTDEGIRVMVRCCHYDESEEPEKKFYFNVEKSIDEFVEMCGIEGLNVYMHGNYNRD